ncbi:transglutaminase domain-containing protein [Polaribacter sp. L3A8]|uniref:transglutaminase domain-containing protein n=1 Tax=Polaribacter sp. L3A8 TaxID=2686361 RepID=UPI00131CB61D|nr:transglutaminase domain-containing protein [Polaribacter sp. L3A8]
MKKITLLLLFTFLSSILIAQKSKSTKLGQTTLDELKMTVYDKDSTATAVVLYEHANRYPDRENDEIPRTDYYFRIKILNKSSFNLADITVNLYKKQKIEDISAITYNITEKGTMNTTYLSDKDIFTTKERDTWTVKKFTLPNIKEGTVIEYKYSVLSPYLGINDWYFQSDIPKIKSEFDASILGNYKYNIRIIGYLKLDKDEPSIDKKCVIIDGIGEGNCAHFTYGMNNIPAFKEEDYMLSKKNYISRISFDLKSNTGYNGVTTDLTTTWKKADKALQSQFFNNQTSKKSFFKKYISEEILTTENTLERAKKVFRFISNHFTWNDNYWTNEDAKVKNAFQEKTGDVGEINISLYNSLKAANIDANLVVLSTRNNGVPTKLFPVIYDYNYVIVQAIIDGKYYYLDATEKYIPFGEVPVRTLNGEARVINYKDKSFWVTLKPKNQSSINISAKLTLDEEGAFLGYLRIRRDGYFASKQRKKISLKSEENYLEDFEAKNENIEVEDYKVKNLDALDKNLEENFTIRLEMNESLGNKIRINPFLFDRLKQNPFKLKERNYPVDFGYSRRNNYYLTLEIPENYTIIKLPENKAISLPNNGGNFILKTIQKGNTISLLVRLNISKKDYSVQEYYALKEFYKQIIILESGYIILEKK